MHSSTKKPSNFTAKVTSTAAKIASAVLYAWSTGRSTKMSGAISTCVCVCGWAARRQPPQTALARTGCGACLLAQFHVNSHAGIFAFALLIWCLRRCGAQGAGMPKHTHTRLAHIKCQDTHTHMGVGCRCFALSLRPANFGRIKVSLLGLRCER